MSWTDQDWSNRHIDKGKLTSKLESMGITVLGWSNRKPDLTREDGQPVDWQKVESVAEKLFLSRPKPQPPKPETPVEQVEKKPVKKPRSRSRKRTTKKK